MLTPVIFLLQWGGDKILPGLLSDIVSCNTQSTSQSVQPCPIMRIVQLISVSHMEQFELFVT